eukprot:659340-Prorocentrum_minimum.AAC.2
MLVSCWCLCWSRVGVGVGLMLVLCSCWCWSHVGLVLYRGSPLHLTVGHAHGGPRADLRLPLHYGRLVDRLEADVNGRPPRPPRPPRCRRAGARQPHRRGRCPHVLTCGQRRRHPPRRQPLSGRSNVETKVGQYKHVVCRMIRGDALGPQL